MEHEIGDIGNYYGGLLVKKEEGRFFWGIENHDGTSWDEIPKSLFYEFINYEKDLRIDKTVR